jgi:small-conductance mechanosensitive channel
MVTDQQQTMKDLQSQPTLESLQTAGNLWQKNQTLMTKWLDLVSQRASQFQSALTQLTDLKTIWGLTLDSAKAANAGTVVLQQINAVILAIENEQKDIETRSSATIILQGRIGEKVAQCNSVLAQISQAQLTVIGNSQRLGKIPIWSAKLWEQARNDGYAQVRETSASIWSGLKPYFFDPSSQISIHFGLLVFLFLIFFMMRRKIHSWAASEDSEVMTNLFDRPFSTALIVTFLFLSSPYLSTPLTLRALFEVLALIAMISLIKATIDQRLLLGLYTLGVLFSLDTVRHPFTDATLFTQILIVTESLAGISVLTWSLVYGDLRVPPLQASEQPRLRVFRTIATILLIALSLGFVTGILGFVLFARLMVSGILFGAASALTLSILVKIFRGVTAFCLRIWPLNLLNMVRHHRTLLESRFYTIAVWLAVAGWLVRVLDYFGLLQPAIQVGKAVLAAKLERGSVSISSGDIFAFILTIWASHLLSAIIRFVLEEDVYPRTKIPRGIGYTASRLLNYLILLIGFILGLGVFGIDLTKVTVLLSAFGVGIGFGLQGVVNNFVSGLVLLFERPIHVDDNIEVAGILGSVKQIGIRASILRSWQGADIIIPNSQLISDKVTNWTLNDRLHRIDLPVGVNYSSPPRKVIEVLTGMASSHSKVLRYPPAQAFLTGFGDSAINFELRVWTDDPLNWSKLKSELGVAVYDAIHEAGMSFPFPQREVRLLRDNEA